jgi:hypothetical protein
MVRKGGFLYMVAPMCTKKWLNSTYLTLCGSLYPLSPLVKFIIKLVSSACPTCASSYEICSDFNFRSYAPSH